MKKVTNKTAIPPVNLGVGKEQIGVPEVYKLGEYKTFLTNLAVE